jgi:hypothetical protein
MDELTWTCHICGKIRPDDKIAVYKHIRRLESGIEFIENVRYCNDNESCIEAAKHFHFL